jgi:hypothetical protein
MLMVAPGTRPGPENEGIVVIMRKRPALATLAAVGGISTHTHHAISVTVDDRAKGSAPSRPRCQWQRDVDGRLRMRWR